jgi:hypothetical protein
MSLEDEVRLRQMVEDTREAIEADKRARRLAARQAKAELEAELEGKINEFEQSRRSVQVFLMAMKNAGNPGLVSRALPDNVERRGFFGLRTTPGRVIEGWDIKRPIQYETDAGGRAGYTEPGVFLSVTRRVYSWLEGVPPWSAGDDFIEESDLVRIMIEHGVTP